MPRLPRSLLRIGAAILATLTVFATARASAPTRVFLPLAMRSSNTPAQNPLHSGEATWYTATGAGNCSFDPSPENMLVAAMNHVDYAASAICGAFVEIYGPQGTITVRIVDQCPECLAGDIDLSQEAFALIAPLVSGRVPITWRVVSPAIAGPIRYHIKDGSNPWWLAVQIRNHRNPIAKIELLNGGSWRQLRRESYNYFIEDGVVVGNPVTLRVTDVYGNVLSDTIPFEVDVDISGAAQFPPGP